MARLYIVPAIGSKPLAKLTPEDVSKMLAGLTRPRTVKMGDGKTVKLGPLSATTRRYCRVVLRIALWQAVRSGLLLRNVAALATAPAAVHRELPLWTAEQLRSFLAATAQDREGPLWAVLAATGLRIGEALGLRWEDIDLDDGTVAVRHKLSSVTRTLGEPKTARSRRTLRTGSTAIAALRTQKARQAAEQLAAGPRWRGAGFVFASTVGTAPDYSAIAPRFRAAVFSAGLPVVTIHSMRHAFATLALEAGEDLLTVSRALGHASVSTTGNVHGHVTPASQDRLAARMDAILTG